MVQVFETRPVGDRRNPADVIWALEARCAALEERVSALEPSKPLPAPLTEGAIVAALGNDSTMAGRIIARLAVRWSTVERGNVAAGAKNQVSDYSDPGARCLQSLAVALAAASYRG